MAFLMFSDCLLLVYGNTTNFYVLIFYPETAKFIY